MADMFNKITESDYGNKGVRLLPSRVVGDAATIQRVFDELSLDVLIPSVNDIVNSLNSLNIDMRVTSDDIKGLRLNSDNVIEVTLDGVDWITVSDPKDSVEALKIYLVGYADGIKNDLKERKADKSNVLEKDNAEEYIPTDQYNPTTKKYVDDIDTKLSTEKADKINVIEKDNVIEFIPTSDYEPATKKYVDEKAYADMTKAIYDPQGRNTDLFKYVDEAVLNTGSADMTKAIYDPQGFETDIFTYTDEAINRAVGEGKLVDDVTEIKTDIGSPEDVSTSPTIFGKLADIKEMLTNKFSEIISKITSIDSKIGTSLDIGTDTIFAKLNNIFSDMYYSVKEYKILDNVNILFSLPTPSVNNYRPSVYLGEFYPPVSGVCLITVDIEYKTNNETDVYLYEQPYYRLAKTNNDYDNISFCGQHSYHTKGTQTNVSVLGQSSFITIEKRTVGSSNGQIKKNNIIFSIKKPKEYINDLILGIENRNATTDDYFKITNVTVKHGRNLWGA